MFEDYFKKLEIHPKELSLELIESMQKAHIKKFSFNNIAVLLKKEISLKTEHIVEKIVNKNLGGYCFEHNQLMYEVLKYLGFDVRILIAKVINNQDIDVARTHRVTLLKWEKNNYLIDVGFGLMCPNKPIKIEKSNNSGHTYRIIQNKETDYILETLVKNSYFSLYKFNLQNYTQADCEMGNFYSAHFPNAVFVNNFLISLTLPNLKLSLRNHTYHKISKEGTQIIEIKNSTHLCSIIRNDFKILLSKSECNELYKYAKVN